MARIRSIKPDAFHSDSLSHVDRGVRWTFAGLWTYLDDDGYGRDDVRLIKAALYPLDEDVTVDVIVDDLKQLEAIGCICRFEVDGKSYLHVPKSPDHGWDHQKINRPTPSKLPCCPEHSRKPQGALTDDSPPDREGKGKEGNREVSAPSAHESFDEFWATYPRKTDKGNAKKAWVKALKKKPAEQIIAAAAAYAATKPEPKFTAHPTTWLNGERWDDEHARAPNDSQRWYPPEVPPDVDPDDIDAYRAAMRKASG
jgi:hypothetical protein